MKNLYPCLITAIAMQLITVNLCNAQSAAITLKSVPANVVIDGNLQEWGDSLSYYNDATQVNYTLANDKDHLYLVLKTNDSVEQAKILRSGVTFSIDTKARKKSSYSVTFPMYQEENKSFGSTGADQEKKLEAGLTKLRKIQVEGFKDVEYDQITIDNTYGFKVAIEYDNRGYLVYEEAIPLALLHADELKKNVWAFNIKINGQQRAALKTNTDEAGRNTGMGGRGGGGRGGRGGAGGRGGRGGGFSNGNTPNNPSSGSMDFWGKFYLANTR